MKLTCLFGTRKGMYEAPELMVAWDEYCLDANPEGFEEECENAKKSWGNDLGQWRIVEIEISQEKLEEHFAEPTLEGEVEAPKPAAKYECCGDPKPVTVDGCLMCDSCGSPLEDLS